MLKTKRPPLPTWHAAHANTPVGWCPGPKPRRALRNQIAIDMIEGDTPDRLKNRLVLMNDADKRRASLRAIVEDLYDQLLRCETVDEAMDPGNGSTSPRMRVRHVHDAVIGKARHMHCHAAIYRSAGAIKRLSAGGLYRPGTAIVHFEHTIPGVVVLPILWRFVENRTLPSPRDLLSFMFDYMVVTALDITERDGSGEASLNARRTLLEHDSTWSSSTWSNKHPDVAVNGDIIDDTRPFRRYLGTGLKVFDYLTGEPIDLACDQIRDHRIRMAKIPIYDAKRYFP
jgi:hypothetical protein